MNRDNNWTSVNWIVLEDRGGSSFHYRLISWQLFVYHVTTISPTVDFGDGMSEGFGWGIPLGYQGGSWSNHIQRVVMGWHLLPHPIASLNYRLLSTSLVGVHERSSTAAPCITTPDTDRPTKGFKSPDFPTISDLLDNSFYMTPDSPSPHESSNPWYEEPTMTYVL